MKKILITSFRIALLGGLVLALGFVALPPTNKAISKMPEVKIQKGKVQQLESNEPNQLIELMARDIKAKQEKINHPELAEETAQEVAPTAQVAQDTEEATEAPVQIAAASQKQIAPEAKLAAESPEEALENAPEASSAPIFNVEHKISEGPISKNPWLRTGLSLAFVISVMFVVASLVKKYVPQSKSKLSSNYSASVQVLHNMTLGLKQQIMVILVEGHRLVIGISGQQMSLLYAIPESKEVRTSSSRNDTIESNEINNTAALKEAKRAAAAPAAFTAPTVDKKIEEPVFPEEDFLDDGFEAVASTVATLPQNQVNQNEFNKKLEAFERYQADQEHIASLRQKVRSQMAAFSERRETGEAVSANVSDKIRSVMRSLKTFNSLNTNQNQKTEKSSGRGNDPIFQKTA